VIKKSRGALFSPEAIARLGTGLVSMLSTLLAPFFSAEVWFSLEWCGRRLNTA
jgi:hypothetical protein